MSKTPKNCPYCEHYSAFVTPRKGYSKSEGFTYYIYGVCIKDETVNPVSYMYPVYVPEGAECKDFKAV